MDTTSISPYPDNTVESYPFPSTVEYDCPTLESSLYQQFSEQDYFSTYQPGVPIIGYTQVPTPTQSHTASPTEIPEEESTIVSVSTVFHPGAYTTPSDLIFSSSDSVLFYVHSRIILQTSPHVFSSLVDVPLSCGKFVNTIINVPESSEVLNIIIHMLYGTSCAHHSPTFEMLATAIDRMPHYGIVPKDHIIPGTSLYSFLLSHAPLYPIELYTLAAHHRLEVLAVKTSSHLLAYPLANITDEAAERMGAVYLRRLMLLHVSRFNALKRILLLPPHPHPETKQCTFEEQKKLTRAWALVSAYLAWDARSDLSTHSMHSAFTPLTEHIDCKLCLGGLNNRIKDVIVQWTCVKRTI